MTCPIKHALDQCQLALGRVQQRQPQAGYTFTATYEAISAARAELARRTPPAESQRLVDDLMAAHAGHSDEGPSTFSEAADELRRLHAVEQGLADLSDVVQTVFDALQDKIDAKGPIAKSNLQLYVNKLREGFTAK